RLHPKRGILATVTLDRTRRPLSGRKRVKRLSCALMFPLQCPASLRSRGRTAASRILLIASSVALAAAGCADGQVSARSSMRKPPQPQLTTRGIQRRALLVSYCWSVPRADGTSAGTCVDGIPRPSRQKLIWRPHSQIILDLALPASHVQVNVATNAR